MVIKFTGYRPRLFTVDSKIIEIDDLSSLDVALFGSLFYPNQQVIDFIAQKGFYSSEILFSNMPLFVFSRFPFYKKLKKAITPSSGAYYLLWHEENKEKNRFGFLLQYLPENSVTSNHYHTKQTESFSVLEGMLSLDTSEGTCSLKAGENHTVKPGVTHQLRTKEKPSLTIIEITNVDYKDHHLVEDLHESK